MRIALAGYGNLGRGVELAVAAAPDMELVAVFTRRDPDGIVTATGAPVFSMAQARARARDVDVLILCTGSASDLPEQTPECAAYFNVVDSFDTHAKIPAHFARVDEALRESGHLGIISVGWDPGLFSLNRTLAEAVLPAGATYTFWGRGVSQGHSDAIRRIPGVADARQYTVPVPAAQEAVRAGQTPALTARQKHTRECYVVLEPSADPAAVERAIREMPDYFADYDTTVRFVDIETLRREHGGLPHAGSVIRTGTTGADGENTHVIEYSLKLDSNPEFTAGALVAYARAAYRLYTLGGRGCRTVLDVAPAFLHPDTPGRQRERLL